MVIVLLFSQVFAIIFMGKRELVALLFCLPGVFLWLFLTVTWIGLQWCVSVLFPYHTHLLCCTQAKQNIKQKKFILALVLRTKITIPIIA